MIGYSKACALATGTALLALGLGATPASADTYIYNYYTNDPGTVTTYRYAPAPRTYYYSDPIFSAPPTVYSTPSTTTYYYGSPSSVYVPPATTYHYAPAPRYYYNPVYAPLFSLEALFSPYSSSSLYDSYRLAPGN